LSAADESAMLALPYRRQTNMNLLNFTTASFKGNFKSGFRAVLLLSFVAVQCALAAAQRHGEPVATPEAPERSDKLKTANDRDAVLRTFKTMYVDATDAQFFDSEHMKMSLIRNGDFAKLHIRIVDDPKVADVVLKVSYTFAWDYPFVLRHQNTSMVLLAGKGEGPFSGPLGAADVAWEFVEMAKRYRAEPEKKQE
jgi:hypothetical protein